MTGVSATDLTDADGRVDPAAVRAEIDALWADAQADENAYDGREDADAALSYLREGAGRAIGLYILLRTGDRFYRFSEAEFARLEEALQTWLSLYAACHGVSLEADCSVRTAAEALLETDDLEAVAALLTGVSPS